MGIPESRSNTCWWTIMSGDGDQRRIKISWKLPEISHLIWLLRCCGPQDHQNTAVYMKNPVVFTKGDRTKVNEILNGLLKWNQENIEFSNKRWRLFSRIILVLVIIFISISSYSLYGIQNIISLFFFIFLIEEKIESRWSGT